MANLETSSGSAQDKRARSAKHFKSLEGHQGRGDSHAQRLEHKLRDQDALIQKMAAKMEMLRPQIKGKGVAGVRNHSEHTPPPRSDSHRQDGTPYFSITRSYGVGDSNPPVERSHTRDSSYSASRPSTTSKYSYSVHSGDLKDVLEE